MRIHPQPNNPDPDESGTPSPEPEARNDQPAGEPTGADAQAMREQIVAALKQVHDPEIPVNIYDLGLVYNVDVQDDNNVHIRMTLTTPNCPEAQSIPGYVQQAAESVPGVEKAEVEIVWEPRWDKDMMSDAAKLQLGFM